VSTSDRPDVCVFWNGLLTNQAIPYFSLLLRMPLPRSVRGSQGGRDDSTPLRKRPTTNTTETNMRLYQLEPRQRVYRTSRCPNGDEGYSSVYLHFWCSVLK
jgi:hypothetical protein